MHLECIMKRMHVTKKKKKTLLLLIIIEENNALYQLVDNFPTALVSPLDGKLPF